ncbi:hypothetical protein N9064_00485 [bacterium]|nr:hypothetical protein [bacterium]
MKTKTNKVEVKVNNADEFRLVRAVLEVRFRKAIWKTNSYLDNSYLYVNNKNEVHSFNCPQHTHAYLTLIDLLNWAKGGFQLEEKELTIEEIQKELGYKIKVIES